MTLSDPKGGVSTMLEPSTHLELFDKLGTLPRALDIAPTRRIYVNRNLRMDEIDLIGFDMDYTLALYHQGNLEKLSIECTLEKLVTSRGYPRDILTLEYDHSFGLRGIVADRQNGNIAKMDRYGHVGRVYHGRRMLPREERHSLYRTQRVRLAHPRYAWIDTLFALPEAVMYATLVEFIDAHPGESFNQGYSQLWQDIRDCIDEAHRDETMKRVIRAHLKNYIVRDPELAPTLHKFRSAGKRLFLLTNSAWDYTDPVMAYLLDGVLPAYPSWRSYFDVIIVSGAKPAFFTEKRPFVELNLRGEQKPFDGTFQHNHLYQGGNVGEFEAKVGVGGDRILYIGDHIYGDMLRAKKSSVWRTAMVIQELEEELTQLGRHRGELARMHQLELQTTRLDSEINYQTQLWKSLQDGKNSDEARREAKRRLDDLRAQLKAATDEMNTLEGELDRSFNPYWGQMFREGTENSRFGEQVEQYACVYTSRASNFLAYSPLRYFRSPRDHMPHEL